MKDASRLFFTVFILFLFSNTSLNAQTDLTPRKDKSGKYGYIDKSESFVIEAKYDKAFSFVDEIARVIVNGKWGLIDNTGNYIVKPKLDYIGWCNDGYFQWNKGNLSLTNTLIPPKNTFYPNFSKVLAYLSDNKWGLINSSGRLIKNEWDSIYYGDGGHFAVFKEGFGWSWIDENNKSQDEKYFGKVIPLSNGIIAAKGSDKVGYKLFDFDGELKSDSVYKHVGSLNSDFIKVRNNFLWYQLDKHAKNVNQETFEEIKYVQGNNTMQYLPYSPWVKSTIDFNENKNLEFLIEYEVQDGLFAVKMDDTRYLWNSYRDKKIALEANDTIHSNPPFIIVRNRNEDYFQLLSYDLQKIASPIQNFITLDSGNILGLQFSSGNWSIWDKPNNSEIISNIGSTITGVSDNEFKLERNGKFGLYNIESQEWTLDPLYKEVFRLNDTMYASLNDDSLKFYGQNGFSKSFDSYRDLLSVNDSVIALKDKSGKWTLRNIDLSKILKEEFSGLALTHGNSVRLKKSDDWALYNILLKRYTLKYTYDSISDNQNGHFILRKNEKWGLIDQRGNFTFQMSDYYKNIIPYDENRWQVYRNGLSGIVDQNGILKISTQYEDFKTPVFGYIPFKFRGKWGLLDQRERFILQPLNDRQEIISENFVQVWKNNLTGMKNLNDKTLIPIEFESIFRNKYGSFIVSKGGEKGFYSAEAQQIRPLSYDDIRQLDAGLIALKKNGYWQVINNDGSLVSDKKFKDIYFDSASSSLFFKETKSWVIKSLD